MPTLNIIVDQRGIIQYTLDTFFSNTFLMIIAEPGIREGGREEMVSSCCIEEEEDTSVVNDVVVCTTELV